MVRTLAFIQLPLVTKSDLSDEESRYYATYWKVLERVFSCEFSQGEVYTIPEFPIWALQLSRVAEAANWHRDFVDLACMTGPDDRINLARMREILRRHPAECYGVSPYTANYHVAVKVLGVLRELFPKATVIVGGAHVSALHSQCAKDGWDAVVRGPAEDALLAVLRAIEDDARIPSLPAMDHQRMEYWFDRVPDYGLLPVNYPLHFGRVFASLGCPYSCAFCGDTIWCRRRPLVKSSATVAEEISIIRRRFHKDLILFDDEVFTLKPDVVATLCEAIRPLGISWFCQTRANLVSPDILKTMANSGCRLIHIGVESADGAVQSALGKKLDMDIVRRACGWARDAGLAVCTYWMVGGPGETQASAERTLGMIMDLFRDGLTQVADYYICTPYPGTAIHADPARFGVTILDRPTRSWREDMPSVMRTQELDEHAIFALWKQGLAVIANEMDAVVRRLS